MSDNILDTYLSFVQAGETEIPLEYHLWCGIAMIAAAVADRVWFEHLGKHLPNLYTLLIGDSASGKGHAITRMEEVISGIDYLHAAEVRASGPALLDILSEMSDIKDKDGRLIDNSKMFIITPELKDNIGSKDKAEDFIAMATSVWEGGRPVPLIEKTRGSGTHILIDPLLNWIAGSTKQWLIESITVSAMQGGFFGRVACVQPSNYDISNRIWDVPNLDSTYKKNTLAYLKKRITELTYVSGAFKITNEADTFLRNWYMTRAVPNQESPVAYVWKRLPQMVFKLCMIFSLADSIDLTINQHHAKLARDAAEKLFHGVQNLLLYASVTPKTEVLYKMTVAMRQHKKLPKAYLLSLLGVTKDDFDLALTTLISSNSVKVKKQGSTFMVDWIGK